MSSNSNRKARLGKGFRLERSDGASPPNWTPIAGLMDVDGPSMSADTIDVTTHDSQGKFREFIAGLRDGGEVTADILFDPDDPVQSLSTGLARDLAEGVCREYRAAWPYPSTKFWQFSAIVTNFNPNAPVADKQTVPLTLKVTGEPFEGNA